MQQWKSVKCMNKNCVFAISVEVCKGQIWSKTMPHIGTTYSEKVGLGAIFKGILVPKNKQDCQVYVIL